MTLTLVGVYSIAHLPCNAKGGIFLSKERFIRDVTLKVGAFLSQEDAEKLRDILVKELRNYDLTEIETAVVPYDDENQRLLKTYCACIALDGKSQKTIRVYAGVLKTFAETIGKKYQDVEVTDVRLFLALQKDKGLSNRSLENTRSYLSAFYQWLLAEEYIAVNPMLKIKPIQYADEIREPFSLTDIDKMRTACQNTRERAVIEVLLSSGVRVSELCDLNRDDIDFHDKTVRVRHGKGDKPRVTYIDILTAMHLQHYLTSRHDDDEALIVSYRGTRLSTGGAEAIVRRIGERAGVEDVHPHRFRRTMATTLATRGMAVQDIQILLGHSDINTTMEYVSVSEQRARLEYQKFTA